MSEYTGRRPRLQEDAVSDDYNNKLKHRFCGSGAISDNDDETKKAQKLVKETVMIVAIEICGVSKGTKGSRNRNVQFDSEVRKTINEKKKAQSDWLSSNLRYCGKNDTRELREEYKSCKKMKKKRKRKRVEELVDRQKEEQKDEFDRRFSDDFG